MKNLFKAVITKYQGQEATKVAFSTSPQKAIRVARNALYELGFSDCGSECLELYSGNKRIYCRYEHDSGDVFIS